MSQTEKAAYYKALKAAGVAFDRHYREYSTEELAAAYSRLSEEQPERILPEPPQAAEPEQAPQEAPPLPPRQPSPPLPPRAPQAPTRVQPRDPAEMPGQRLNVQPEDEPIRTDESGLVWYQEEVRKPSYAKPRGRRVLKYMESGVETQTVQDGQYVETFEVAGRGPQVPAEVKVTLPSYQVGIYRDPRMPFKVHVYNEVRGFDLFEVQDYYGGAEMVPAEVKRMYVENVLCYDMRTTIRAIQTEYRQLQLAGKVQ